MIESLYDEQRKSEKKCQYFFDNFGNYVWILRHLWYVNPGYFSEDIIFASISEWKKDYFILYSRFPL